MENESRLAQQYQNKLNNAQGQHFEREILAGCKLYAEKKIAKIDKTPEPFRVTSKNRNGVFTGRFTAHAQPDFQGTLNTGRSIMFEAKRTNKDRIQRNVLTDNQMQVLEDHNRLGALCGVCVSIQDEFFFIPWRVWRDMKEIYGRQYLKAEDIGEYKVRFDGAVHFLDRIEAQREKQKANREIAGKIGRISREDHLKRKEELTQELAEYICDDVCGKIAEVSEEEAAEICEACKLNEHLCEMLRG